MHKGTGLTRQLLPANCTPMTGRRRPACAVVDVIGEAIDEGAVLDLRCAANEERRDAIEAGTARTPGTARQVMRARRRRDVHHSIACEIGTIVAVALSELNL